jgi:hypothetical protein
MDRKELNEYLKSGGIVYIRV